MPTLVPVAVHMWFVDGAGWAYHPNLKPTAVLGAVNEYLQSGTSQERVYVRFSGGILVGEKLPDENCKDPKAVNRSPFILRFGYLNQDASDQETVDRFLRRL